MKLELVAFTTCPYVHRPLILLHEAGLEHTLTILSKDDKPDWLWEISPRGKVPVLLADGEAIFESHAICEFIDETSSESPLMPGSPLHRARDRAWFAFASDAVYPRVYQLMNARFEKKVRRTTSELVAVLEALEAHLEGREWLSGDGTRFGMADVAMAPAAWRLDLLRDLGGFEVPESLPRFASWMERVLARPSVPASAPEGAREALVADMHAAGAWIVTQQSQH